MARSWTRVKKKEITPADFVTAWQTSATLEEVSDRLQCSELAASQRARQFRKAGVNLKKMAAKKGVNVQELNNLITHLQNGAPRE
jgi:hypothetical protein